MRTPKPWYRKQSRTWYVCWNGRQVNLGRDKRQAYAKYHKLMLAQPTTSCKVGELVAAYSDWLTANRAADTVDRRKPQLRSFLTAIPKTLRAADLKPYHVQRWVDANWTNPTTKGDKIGLIKTVCNWGVQMGYLDANPVAAMKRPSPNIRQEYVPADLWSKVLALATDEQFKNLLFVMLASGARTTEILRFEAKHLDGNRFVLPIHDSKGRRRSRVVYLPDEALKIVKQLATERPTGKLFVNKRGRPWNRNSIKCRFRRLKDKLTMPRLTSTTLRHSFAHHRLTSGQDSLTVAKLMGHVDTRMLSTRYGHIDSNPEYMTAAANGVAFPA